MRRDERDSNSKDSPAYDSITSNQYRPGSDASQDSPLIALVDAIALAVVGVAILVAVNLPLSWGLNQLSITEFSRFIISASIGQYIAFVGLGVLYIRKKHGSIFDVVDYVGISIPTHKGIFLIIVGWATILVYSATVGVFVEMYFPNPAENQATGVFSDQHATTLIIVTTFAFMLLVVGPCEEFLYRGVIQTRLRNWFSPVTTILIASVIFVLVHTVSLEGSINGIIGRFMLLFGVAAVLGMIYEYTENVVIPALLHGIHNSIALLGAMYAEPNAVVASVKVVLISI